LPSRTVQKILVTERLITEAAAQGDRGRPGQDGASTGQGPPGPRLISNRRARRRLEPTGSCPLRVGEIWRTRWLVIRVGAIQAPTAARARVCAHVVGVGRRPTGEEPLDRRPLRPDHPETHQMSTIAPQRHDPGSVLVKAARWWTTKRCCGLWSTAGRGGHPQRCDRRRSKCYTVSKGQPVADIYQDII
jgi:hypothetical protein